MKRLFLILIIMIVFFACAVIGYQLTTRIDQNQVTDQAGKLNPPSTGGQGGQHNLVVVHVDQLDGQRPRLVSAWFVSLFFVEGASPNITLAQIYPVRSRPATEQALERSFSLTYQGDPAPGFWQAVSALKIKWEGYLVIDDQAVQKTMTWALGPGDYSALSGMLETDPAQVKQTLLNSCQAVGGISNREASPFDWGDLVPAHFRSNLRMETALAYWDKITRAEQPVRCDVLMAP